MPRIEMSRKPIHSQFSLLPSDNANRTSKIAIGPFLGHLKPVASPKRFVPTAQTPVFNPNTVIFQLVFLVFVAPR